MDFVLDKEGIKDLIPHRDPFLFLDSVLEINTDDQYILCKSNISKDDWFFKGHFPSYPIMPGVLIIESLAQAAAVYSVYTIGDTAKGKPVFFTSIEKAKFRNPVLPPAELTLYAKLIRKSSKLWKFSCIAKIGDKVAAESDITATIGMGSM